MTTSKISKENRRRARARQLLALASRSTAHRHLAYWLTGWSDWLDLLPSAPSRKTPTRFRHILAGGGVLVLALCVVVGPLLRVIQPVLVAMGRLDYWMLLVGALLLANAMQWLSGMVILRRVRDLLDDVNDGLRPL
jgi:Tfp pilus assembly protein PilN